MLRKTPYFEIAPPGHNIAYKNVDYLFKHRRYIALFDMWPTNMMFKKYLIFH